MSIFERMLRGTTVKTQQSQPSTEKLLENEMEMATTIPDESKDEVKDLALSMLNDKEHSDGSSSDSLTIPAAIAAAAAFVALKPSTAQAGITGRLVSRFTERFSPLLSGGFTEMFNGMLPNWFDTAEGASTANTVAVASMADGVNHVKSTTHNQSVQAASAGDPQKCELDSTCDDEMVATATETARTVNASIALDMSSQEQDGNTRGNDFRQQIQRAEDNGGNAADIVNTEILYTKQGYNTPEEAAHAFDVAKNISGTAKQSRRQDEQERLRQIGATTEADRLDVQRATSMSRRSLANHIIAEQMTRRDNRSTNGQLRRSSARIDNDEISRTHTSSPVNAAGGAGYTDQLNEFVHAAPLMRQFNFQQARTNSLLVQELEAIMKGNILTGVQIMELLDRRGNI